MSDADFSRTWWGKMKKNTIILLSILITTFLYSCSKTEDVEEIIIKIAAPKAAPTIPIIRMIQNNVLKGKAKIEMSVWSSPEELIAMTLDNDYDLFVMPLTVASKLYNKDVDIKILSITTWDTGDLVTTDKSLESWEDLRGKTLYVPSKSSTPDILTKIFLDNAGIGEDDINIVYSSIPEITQLIAADKIEYATLTEPSIMIAKTKNDNIKTAFNFKNEWTKIKGSNYNLPNVCFSAKNDFLEENNKIVDEFLEEYEIALNWVLENCNEAATISEEYLNFNKDVLEDAIPSLGLIYKSASESKNDLNIFFSTLYEFEPESIGNKIPDNGIYYSEMY